MKKYALIALCMLAVACGEDSDKGSSGKAQGGVPGGSSDTGSPGKVEDDVVSIEIKGTWKSNFGGTETISDTEWESAYDPTTIVRSKVVYYNNTSNIVVTQNPSDDAFFPNAFNKNVWTEISNGVTYYCTVAYGKTTQEEALNDTAVADSTDPATAGCGGFSWTKLTLQ